MALVLIVDDEKPVRQLLVAAFEQSGHQVLEVWHGRHALNLLASTRAHPDIIISDVMMPVVSGLELCRIIKTDPSTADIPIVLISAAHARSAATSTADAFIGKPFDLDTLDVLVDRLLAAHADRGD